MNNRPDLIRLVDFNCQVLDQALSVIDAHEADPQVDFSDRSGPHLRHVIEHYEALLGHLGERSVDYDTRARDREVESDTQLARARIGKLKTQLRQLASASIEAPIAVQLRGGLDGQENFISFSTLGRELLFLASHAVHHYAMVQLHCRAQGIDLGPHFGKAPSTRRHEAR